MKKTDELLLCEMSWCFIYLLLFASLFSDSDKVVSAASSPPSSSRVPKRHLDEDRVSYSKGENKVEILSVIAKKNNTSIISSSTPNSLSLPYGKIVGLPAPQESKEFSDHSVSKLLETPSNSNQPTSLNYHLLGFKQNVPSTCKKSNLQLIESNKKKELMEVSRFSSFTPPYLDVPFYHKKFTSQYSLTQTGHEEFIFSHGTLSWTSWSSCRANLISSFEFVKNDKILYFESAKYSNHFIFKYACTLINVLLVKEEEKEWDKYFATVIIHYVEELFPTIDSLNLYFRPTYDIFGSKYQMRTFMQCPNRIPLYFLFTGISYLIQTPEAINLKFLRFLLQMSYEQLNSVGHFQSEEWDFLKNLVFVFPAHPRTTSNIQFKEGRYDISTVSFIHHEMTQSKCDKVREFFSKLWKIYKEESESKEQDKITVSKSPLLIFSFCRETGLSSFEKEARKLYQIEYTDLLFGNWITLDDLLVKYLELKRDFDTFVVDFRLRDINSKDLELLKKVVKRLGNAFKIYLELPAHSHLPDEQSNIIRCFTVELINFIYGKCYIFSRGYDKEFHVKPDKKIDCTKAFENIIEIYESSKEIIQSITSVNIHIEKHLSFFLNDQSNPKRPAFFDVCHLFYDFEGKPYELGYGGHSSVLSNSIRISKFYFSEYLAQLDEAISSENYSKVFSDPKYEPLIKLWKFKPKDVSKLTCEEQKIVLEQLRNFLFHYNQ